MRTASVFLGIALVTLLALGLVVRGSNRSGARVPDATRGAGSEWSLHRDQAGSEARSHSGRSRSGSGVGVDMRSAPIASRAAGLEAWWLYRPRAPEACGCKTMRFEVVAEGSPGAEMDESIGEAALLVVQSDGRRCSNAIDAYDREATGRIDAKGLSFEFEIFDADSLAPVQATLLDDSGLPLGPIGGEFARITLPRSFEGRIAAKGYAPALFRAADWYAPLVRIEMHRACCASGRLPPGVELDGAAVTMTEHRTAPGPRVSVTTLVDAQGRFHLGPLTPGLHGIALEAKDVLLRKESRQATLQVGPNDLGELAVEILHSLWLRVIAGGRRPEGQVFARLWFAAGEAPLDLPGAGYRVTEDGLLRIEGVREQAIDVELWTRSGHAARLSSIRAADTSRTRPLDIALADPCRLIVSVDAPGVALPAGCEFVAHAAGSHAATARFVSQAPLNELRALRVPLARESGTAIEGVWPGAIEIALLSPQGARLAETTIDLQPGERRMLTLNPAPPLGVLVIRANARGGRVALLSSRDGAVARTRVEPGRDVDLVVPAGDYRGISLDEARTGGDEADGTAVRVEPGQRTRFVR